MLRPSVPSRAARRHGPFSSLAAFAAAAGVVTACGGGAGHAPGGAKGAADERAGAGESIGDLAAAQGGLGALGGGEARGGTGLEAAMSGPLLLEQWHESAPPKVDGRLKEWHPRTPAPGATAGGPTLTLGLAHDDTKIWIAAEIGDTQAGELRLALAFPVGKGLRGYTVTVRPGHAGESAGEVLLDGKALAGAKVVEMPVDGGVSFEAVLPWAAFAEAATVRVGLRGSARWVRKDGQEIATGPGDAKNPKELPPLPTSAEHAVVEGLLAQKGLANEPPTVDVFADVAGDARKERVALFGRYLTVCGPGYRGGKEFFWKELTGEVVALEARDLTGRGKDDLVLRRRSTGKDGTRERLEVYGLVGGDEPTLLFAHDIVVASGKRRVSNAVRLGARDKAIEITTEPAVGFDVASFGEAGVSDAEPVLVPWGTVKSRTFKWNGKAFEVASEVAQAGVASAATPATAARREPELPRDVPTPKVGKAGDLAGDLFRAYLKERGLPETTKPRTDLSVHVDGDPRPERVALVGRDVVVLGPGFRDGRSYATASLTQFEKDDDVGELTARDLDGDGAADLVVRGRRAVEGGLTVEALFVYKVEGGAVKRVFGVETAREQAGKRVQGLVQFVPVKGGKGFEVDVRPGAAKGWTKDSCPFGQAEPGKGGPVEPLLLPWGGIANVKYRWDGQRFAATTP